MLKFFILLLIAFELPSTGQFIYGIDFICKYVCFPCIDVQPHKRDLCRRSDPSMRIIHLFYAPMLTEKLLLNTFGLSLWRARLIRARYVSQ